jgi:hypothetical protein
MRASTSGGVPLGAHMPNQMSRLAPGKPCSATVGTSGKNGERLALTMPSSLALPVRMCGNAMPGSHTKSAWPESTSCSAGAAPR